MFKKIILSLSIITIAQFAFAKAEDKILAKVDGKEVHESEIKDTISTYASLNALGEDANFNYDTLTPEIKKEIVKSIIVGELLLGEAKKSKVNETAEYKQSLLFAEKQLTQKLFLDKLIKENVTDAKMKERYKQMAAQQANKQEYKVSHILVKTEEEAKTIKAKLDKSEDFASLAKEFSLDGNKNEGGSLGYFSNGQMVPAFEEAAAALKVGAISGPVKTDFGYHIIKLEDKRQAKAEDFEKMRSKIFDSMAAQFVQDYIAQLQTQNKVELF